MIQLEQSRQAEAEGIYGADRWTQNHLRKIETMRTILTIHEDDSIPDGAVINLEAARQDNEIAMAIRDRNAHDGGDTQTGILFDQDATNALETMWDD